MVTGSLASAYHGTPRTTQDLDVIDAASGWKADLVIRKDRPFSVEEFSRRTPAQVLGVHVAIATPEDRGSCASGAETWISLSAQVRKYGVAPNATVLPDRGT
jgi:hypothetical protein